MSRPPADGVSAAAALRLVVPAYFHPAVHPDQWEWLAQHASEVRLVILNVASGPGTGPDPVFSAMVERLHEAGVRIAGYVDTNYGHRPPAQVIPELGCYLDWYGVEGVCYDRVAVTAGQLGHYAALAARARAMGVESVFFNHGAYPLEPYAEHADLLGTFEGPWPAYQRLAVPRWTAAWEASKFYHVVYAVPPERSDDALLLASRRHVGSVYITDRSGPNPYDELPVSVGGPESRRHGQGPASPAPAAGAMEMAGGDGPPAARFRGHRSSWPRRYALPALLATIVLLIAGVAWATGLLPGTGSRSANGKGAVVSCQKSFIPAFFSPGTWAQVLNGKPRPSVMILDLTNTGAGSSPEPAFQAVVKRAQADGVEVLGYVATSYGSRPMAQAETDVRNYAAWYGVSSIFLDQTPDGSAQIGYYRSLANYIHGIDRDGAIWINPGLYPSQAYMSVANVIMAFEGSYASYHDSRVPDWARRYPPGRFADTIYATSGSQFASTRRLSADDNAGFVFITDGSGANPYSGLPTYWSDEDAAVAATCAHSG